MTIHAFTNNTSVQNASEDTHTTTGALDAELRQVSATTNYETGATLPIQNPNLASSVRTSIIKFDISAIPVGQTISDAKLYLTLILASGEASQDIGAHRLLRDWVEAEATWNIYSTGNNWGTGGGLNTSSDIVATATDTVAVGNTTSTWVEFDVTADVQDFYNGDETNYGWLLQRATQDTGAPSTRTFYSADVGTATVRPELIVTYAAAASGGGASSLIGSNLIQ